MARVLVSIAASFLVCKMYESAIYMTVADSTFFTGKPRRFAVDNLAVPN